MRVGRTLIPVLLACAFLPAATGAAPSVKLNATLTPEHLGQGTTVGFELQITAGGETPPPITALDVFYPENLGIAVSGLGLATCTPQTLETFGPHGCPANSRMGYGTAVIEVPLGPEAFIETAHITILRAPTHDGHLALLFNIEGKEPVSAQIVLDSLLLPTPAPYGGRIGIPIPIVPSLPAGPDASVVRLHATIGPQHITYYEQLHGRTIAYRPKGLQLPNSCPRRGFPFAATLTFLEGSQVSAHASVRCPTRVQRMR
jgi:hypothetical protein